MDNKIEQQIIADWLSAVKRQVRQTDNTTSVFVSSNFNAPVDKIWEAWTDPAILSVWLAKVIGEIRAGKEITFDVGAPFTIKAHLLKLLIV